MDAEQEKMMDEVAVKLREINEMDVLEQYLQDSINEFVYLDKHYRVHKPTPVEKEVANKERMKKYFEMLKDSNYMFRKALVSLYKTKNIDIDAMDFEVKNLFLSEKGLLKRLGETADPQDIELLEKEIMSIRRQQQDIFLQKEELLKYCIEQQLEDFLKFYLVYLVLEVKNGENWERVYKSYVDFMNSPDDMLQAKAAQVFAVMLYNENI